MLAVVIPTYRAATSILNVLDRVGPEVGLIVVVDDCCPENCGAIVEQQCLDPRVVVLRHEVNLGVGGAFLTGMSEALNRGAQIIIKVDADGQIAPELVPALIKPILSAQADYVKGNRFHFLSDVRSMPRIRIFGNLSLSFLTKLASGYWNIMDPTNGFFAIHAKIARHLRPETISNRFFFESDMLYHLGLIGAKVVDFPMRATYGDEESNLKIGKILGPFLIGNIRNASKRIIYKYFVRDFSIASLELLVGLPLFILGAAFGLSVWVSYASAGVFTPIGTVMLAVLPILIGFQLLLAFLNFDISTSVREVLHPLLDSSGDSDNDPNGNHHGAKQESRGKGLIEQKVAHDRDNDETRSHEHVGSA